MRHNSFYGHNFIFSYFCVFVQVVQPSLMVKLVKMADSQGALAGDTNVHSSHRTNTTTGEVYSCLFGELSL